MRFKGFRVEHLRHVGWQLFRAATYVNWCGHGQEVIPVPLAGERVTFVPVLGESTPARCTRYPGHRPAHRIAGVRVQRPPKRRGFLAWGRENITDVLGYSEEGQETALTASGGLA